MNPAIQILEHIRFNAEHNIWNAGIIICSDVGATLVKYHSPITCGSIEEARAEVKQLMEFIQQNMGGTFEAIEYH